MIGVWFRAQGSGSSRKTPSDKGLRLRTLPSFCLRGRRVLYQKKRLEAQLSKGASAVFTSRHYKSTAKSFWDPTCSLQFKMACCTGISDTLTSLQLTIQDGMLHGHLRYPYECAWVLKLRALKRGLYTNTVTGVRTPNQVKNIFSRFLGRAPSYPKKNQWREHACA